MATLQEIINDNHIEFAEDSPFRIPENPNMTKLDDDLCKAASHWECTLIRNIPVDEKMPGDGCSRPTLTVPFSMGAAHTKPPTVANVLDCLASDATGIEDVLGFADWAEQYDCVCRECGRPTKDGERIYLVIGEQSEKLKTFLGEATYQTLLWNTERL